MRIGVAGLGRMGAAMAERLIAVGHEVHVWNRTPAKAKPLIDDLVKTLNSKVKGKDVTLTLAVTADAIGAVAGKDE